MSAAVWYVSQSLCRTLRRFARYGYPKATLAEEYDLNPDTVSAHVRRECDHRDA